MWCLFKITLADFQCHLFHMNFASLYVLGFCSLGPLCSSYAGAPTATQARTVSVPPLMPASSALAASAVASSLTCGGGWPCGSFVIVSSSPCFCLYMCSLGPRIYVYTIDLGHSPFKSPPPRKFRDPKGLEDGGRGSQSGGSSFTEHVLCARNSELGHEGTSCPEIYILEIQDEQKPNEQTNKLNYCNKEMREKNMRAPVSDEARLTGTCHTRSQGGVFQAEDTGCAKVPRKARAWHMPGAKRKTSVAPSC